MSSDGKTTRKRESSEDDLILNHMQTALRGNPVRPIEAFSNEDTVVSDDSQDLNKTPKTVSTAYDPNFMCKVFYKDKEIEQIKHK